MRISFSMTYDKAATNITRKQGDLDRLSNEISTGKKLQDPHDDPMAWSKALGLKQGKTELEAFRKNLDFADGWNKETSNALNEVQDLLVQAQNVGMAAVSQTDTTAQAVQATQVKKISEEILKLANSQYGDSYIFSGRSTSTPPFQTGNYTYWGDTQSVDVRVGKNTHETVNYDGQATFFTDPADPNSNMMKMLDDLATAIQTGDVPTIQNQLSALDKAREQINSIGATVGVRQEDIQRQQSMLQTKATTNAEQLSDTEDADLAEVITQLQMKKTAFEAALQSTALISNLSLTKFL